MEIYHQANLRKGRVSLENYVYFITKCMLKNLPLRLNQPEIAEILISELIEQYRQRNCKIGGFVVMPDHVHFSVVLSDKIGLSKLMNLYFGNVSYKINKTLKRNGKLWQTGYFDHLLRNKKSFRRHLNYMHENPLRKGLVKNSEDWIYSTANEKYAHLIEWEYFA